uniref:Uncharacterized protein n=1 Tax=Magallana gigas TaxID=29159 RepID=A0A8W8ISR0_MAGGI
MELQVEEFRKALKTMPKRALEGRSTKRKETGKTAAILRQSQTLSQNQTNSSDTTMEILQPCVQNQGDIDAYAHPMTSQQTTTSTEFYSHYKKDLDRGIIGEEILQIILYPPYLASFDFTAENLIVCLNDQELTEDNKGDKSAYSLSSGLC